MLAAYFYAGYAEPYPVQEWKHYFPRLFDCVYEDAFQHVLPDCALIRVGQVQDSEWTAEEKVYVDRFRAAVFERFLEGNDRDGFGSTRSVLLMLLRSGVSEAQLNDFLALWSARDTISACCHYAKAHDEFTSKKSLDSTPTPEDRRAQLTAWLTAPQTSERFRPLIEAHLAQPDSLNYGEKQWLTSGLKALKRAAS